MKHRDLSWFALGMLAALVVVGATLNLRNDGIEFPDGSIQMTAAATDARTSYYLTDFTRDGASTLTACATGYHFASLYEILDPSNLRYAFDHDDAETNDDSGGGPPSDVWGWIRTGENTPGPTEVDPGEANCDSWTSNSDQRSGTRIELEDKWEQFTEPSTGRFYIGPWDLETATCDDLGVETHVWCIED